MRALNFKRFENSRLLNLGVLDFVRFYFKRAELKSFQIKAL